MVIGAVDIETQGLDARKFLMGHIKLEDRKKGRTFYDKTELWEYIKRLGYQEFKRRKVLNLYAHNAVYDFNGYADLTDPDITYYCHRPFIASYSYHNREGIKFLDTFSLFKMSLAKIGLLVGLPKLETPQQLLESTGKISKSTLAQIEPYMIRDVEIVLKSIEFLKNKLASSGIKLKRLYTINQIAIGYLTNEIKHIGHMDHIFLDQDKSYFHRPRFYNLTHGAYRGGRVECFKTGIIEGASGIDCNSLYPWASLHIPFPDLRTESYYKKPLESFSQEELLSKIGLSRCIIKNTSCTLSLLPVRTENGNYYSKTGTHIIGTWTHLELQKAISEGYEILDIEWSVVWDEGLNPFSTITPKLYHLRKKHTGLFNDYFYKMMMNASYGKLAQRKVGSKIIVDDIEKVKEYLNNNYKVIRGIGYNYMYEHQGNSYEKKKPYYCPIIPTLINAWARCYMYDSLKKIPLKHLLYTDTDSIYFIGHYLNKFTIGNGLGEFKEEHRNKKMIIYGRKTYKIGDTIKISGIYSRGITEQDFESGFVSSRKMVTIKKTCDLSLVGSFIEEKRDLHKQLSDYTKSVQLLNDQQLLIDSDITNINSFLPIIETIK